MKSLFNEGGCGMPTCKKCQRKWTWKDTVIRTFKKKKKCPYCGEVQYTTFKSSQRMAWYSLILPFVFVVISLVSLPAMFGVISSAFIFLIGVLTQPFFTKLSSKEEFPE
jgi:CXXC-20-CXXC protein